MTIRLIVLVAVLAFYTFGHATTTTCGDGEDAKNIVISKMIIYTLCGASAGEADVVFKMESDDDWKTYGIPSSLSKTATVEAVEDKDVWITVGQSFVQWPAKFDGKLVDKMKVIVEEDDFFGDDTLGESSWIYYDDIPIDGSEYLVSGSTTDASCIENGGSSLDPSFEVKLTATCGKKESSSSSVCFSGDSTVQLKSGEAKTIAEVEVGDEILSADSAGRLSYSEVVFLPHGFNTKPATFVKATTVTGKAVTATPTHLLAACDGSLVEAKAASCLRTVDGDEAVVSLETVKGRGIYSAVTLHNEFLVVDGVVASPFAMVHSVVDAYYNVHRALYTMLPSLMKLPAVVSANALLGVGAVFAMNALAAASGKSSSQ